MINAQIFASEKQNQLFTPQKNHASEKNEEKRLIIYNASLHRQPPFFETKNIRQQIILPIYNAPLYQQPSLLKLLERKKEENKKKQLPSQEKRVTIYNPQLHNLQLQQPLFKIFEIEKEKKLTDRLIVLAIAGTITVMSLCTALVIINNPNTDQKVGGIKENFDELSLEKQQKTKQA